MQGEAPCERSQRGIGGDVMIQAQALIEKFNYALNDKWGYIYGESGARWTQEKQDKATREQTKKWGSRWVDHQVADCSGLFVWAFKKLGGSIYHGSNTIWKSHLSAKGKIVGGKKADGQALQPGTAVFKTKGEDRHHIGLYVGGDKVIEAKGTYYGVVASAVTAWDEWGELKAVEYAKKAGSSADGGIINQTSAKAEKVVSEAENGYTDSQKLAILWQDYLSKRG